LNARTLAASAAFLALPFAHIPAQVQRLTWVPDPRRATGGWVSDPAHHLSPATVDSINAIITRLEQETSIEMAVVVIDSLDGLEPADAALLLHRQWGVGKAARDNGLLLLWSPKLRKIWVSVGQGLEGVLPDARTGRIQDEAMLPAFRDRAFDRGVLDGVRALASAAREETDWRDNRLGITRESRAEVIRRNKLKRVLYALGALVAALASIPLLMRWRRNRPRKCPKGHGPMRRLTESDDDFALDKGERVEEDIKSIDYDVWVCPTCDEKIKVPYKSWTSGFSICGKCKRRTLETKTKTLKAATESREGRQRVTKTCRNCGWSKVTEETIPRVTSSSSGSSSSGGGSSGGGSSFGGGSSGGGGAGRSY
jgi:uncharacterized protein